MKGRVVDRSHFRFHVECKAKILNALGNLRKGGDFLKALSKLSFSTDKRWTRNSCNDPNVAVLLEILEEYKKLEGRPNRAGVIGPLIEYAIGLYASDLFYRERGEWFMYQLCKRADKMRFHKAFVDPENWYPRKRTDADPCIEDIDTEYLKWYGIDTTDENSVISYDMKKVDALIANQARLYDEEVMARKEWAEGELSKA